MSVPVCMTMSRNSLTIDAATTDVPIAVESFRSHGRTERLVRGVVARLQEAT